MEVRTENGRLLVRRRPDARFAWGCLAPAALAVWLATALAAGLGSRGHPLILGALLLAGAGLFLPVLAYARAAWRLESTSSELSFVKEGLFGERRRSWPAGDVAAIRALELPAGEQTSCFLVLELRNGTSERLTSDRSDDLREVAELLVRERPTA